MRHKPRTDEELEAQALIRRTEYGYKPGTEEDIAKLERKLLGPLWGRKRRKMKGWPR